MNQPPDPSHGMVAVSQRNPGSFRYQRPGHQGRADMAGRIAGCVRDEFRPAEEARRQIRHIKWSGRKPWTE